MLLPDQKTPDLSFPVAGGDPFSLSEDGGKFGTFILFYRGLHCPVCRKQLGALEEKLGDFEDLGVKVIAVSMDDKGRAEEMAEKAGLEKLRLGYDLSLDDARRWGLYISESISDAEPRLFSEPGHFIVRSDGRLLYVAIQNMPFARPQLDDLTGAIKFVQDKGYPARGTYTTDAPQAVAV